MSPIGTDDHGGLLGRFDPLSQQVIRRLLVKLVAIAVFTAAVIHRPAAESVLVLAYVNFLLALVMAVLNRERCNTGALNHWDEAVVFAGLCAVAHAATWLVP